MLAMDIQWDFCQIQLNYQDWKYATGWNVNAEYLYGELEKHNVPAIVMEPLLGGRLARVPVQALTMMKESHPEDSAAKWAFHYTKTPENEQTMLSGMIYMEHLQENILTYSPLQELKENEYKTLERVTEILINSGLFNARVQYCMLAYALIPCFSQLHRCVSAGKFLKVDD